MVRYGRTLTRSADVDCVGSGGFWLHVFRKPTTDHFERPSGPDKLLYLLRTHLESRNIFPLVFGLKKPCRLVLFWGDFYGWCSGSKARSQNESRMYECVSKFVHRFLARAHLLSLISGIRRRPFFTNKLNISLIMFPVLFSNV